MKHILFGLKSTSSLSEAKNEIISLHGKEIYTIEDVDSKKISIGAFFQKIPKKFLHLEVVSINSPEIDWEGQWQGNPHYNNGILTIPLEIYRPSTPPIKLLPGKGFGDLTHPTTRLMLQFLSSTVQEKTIIDIGSGSGVLSFASIFLGASFVYGIEIDKSSLKQSQKNCLLNNLQDKILFAKELSKKMFISNPVILMNMIEAEQKIIWESLSIWQKPGQKIITSGILSSQKTNYILLAESWGWKLLEERQEDEWMAFRFISLE